MSWVQIKGLLMEREFMKITKTTHLNNILKLPTKYGIYIEKLIRSFS